MKQTFKLLLFLLILFCLNKAHAQFDKKLEVKAYLDGGPIFGTELFKPVLEIFEISNHIGYGVALNYNLNQHLVFGINYTITSLIYTFKDSGIWYTSESSSQDYSEATYNEVGINTRYNFFRRKNFKIYTQCNLLLISQHSGRDPFSFIENSTQDMKLFVLATEVSMGLKRNLIKNFGATFDLGYAYQPYYHGPKVRLGLFLDLIED